MLHFDLETDGLLPEVSKIHTITTCRDSIFATYDPQDVHHGVNQILEADAICGHNIIGYDLPVLKKLTGRTPKATTIRDTMVMARLAYPEIKEVDFALMREGKRPGKLIGSHSLKAWGCRLGEHKGDYTGGWETWSQEMSDYCKQDVKVETTLFNRIMAKGIPEEALFLEHAVQQIIYRQTAYGFLFDKEKAEALYALLLKKQRDLQKILAVSFPPWEEQEVFIPKRNNKTLGYVKDVPFVKSKTVEFNPASRHHIVSRLGVKYGWKPTEFTDGGTPSMDETILKALPFLEAATLAEYFMILKRIGQVAEGKEAWLTHVAPDGRIHGSINTCGAVTRRMTHSHPNMAQVPRVGSEYGLECRGLFTVPAGRVLVGADASGLELRCLAHYMAAYDDGAYARQLLQGDIHTVNQEAAGLPTRDKAKTFIYAFLYGAGDDKIGSIIGKGAAAGRAIKAKFLASLPALADLKDAVESAVRQTGVLKSLDGAPMKVRSQHAALNTLLQGAGAIVMKQALVLLDSTLQRKDYIPGRDFEFVANVHDEWQIECRELYADDIGTYATKSITEAGNILNLRCPMAGEYKVGRNWAETH